MNFKDFGLSLGAGRRLILAGIRLGWLWLVVGAAALVLVVMLYRYERRLVSRRTGLTLLAMRLFAALALVAALFEPIARTTYREAVRGRVIVGVDLSESMATDDPSRSAENKEALVKAFNLSPAESADALPRREVARRLLKGAWMSGVADGREVDVIGFAKEAVPGTADSLAKQLGEGHRPDDPAGLLTDWEPVLESALKEKDAAPVLGVVLLTDGRRNAPGDPGPVADRLAARGIPVYPVLIGSTKAPRDAAIAAVKAPDGVYKGDTASVEVTLKLDAPEGTEVPVTLDRPGASPLKKTAKVPGDGSRPVVAFRVPLDTVGPQALTVAVGPLEGDVRPDNDRRTVTVQVADDKANVLLVDGESRWEFRYLRNALARDPRVTLDAVVFEQPPAPSTAEVTYKDKLPQAPEASSKQADPLGSFDAIVLGDVPPEALPAEAWSRLDRYVAERGGTLVLASGPRSFVSLAANESARKMLPVIDPRPVPFDAGATDASRPSLPAGVSVAPIGSGSGEGWPMLQFAAEAEKNRETWAALPKLPWVVAGRPKPAAAVLASAEGLTTEGGDAVIAAMPYGLGKVLWIGTDGTWRWRYRVGDAYHHRFWGQVVRWAASGKLSAGNRLVRFGPDRPKVPEADLARLQARFAEDAPGVGPDLLVAARVFRAGKPASPGDPPTAEGDALAVVPLRPKPGEPRMFEASAPTLPTGSYIIRLDVPQMADALKAEGPSPEALLEVSPRDTSERIELSASRDALDRLASTTGGQVFTDDQAAALPALLKSKTRETTRTEEFSLWDRPWALLLFFGVLTVEWVVRKRAGLP